MVTKKTRALSLIAVALMLVSMFACFVIPASAADGDGVAAIKAMYADVLENASADTDGALAAALAAEYDSADAAKTALAEAAAGVTLKDGIKPRTSFYDAYKAAGYAANVWAISTAEDWTYMTTTKYAELSQAYMYYYVTNDIDFKGVQMGVPDIFRGYVYGQGYSFLNINVVESNAGGENAGLGLVGRTHWGADQGTHAVGFENLTVTGTMSYTSTGAAFGGTFVGNHQNGTFVLKNCTSKVAVTFTASGTASIKFGGLVGRANGGDITGSEFAGTMTVKNSTNTLPYVGGILGFADGVKDIKGNTFSGTLNYTTTVNSVDDFVGGIVGYVNSSVAGQAVIDSCAFTGMINDTSAVATAGITNKGATGGIVGYMGSANNIVNNCYSIGTIVSAGGSATSLGYLHNAGKYYNSIGAGVMISGGGLVANTALKSHSNIGTSDAASVYAVNMNLAFFKADSSTQAATATANSAAEAAYKLNSNYNVAGGTQTYFTMKDGKIAFGTEANQIRKVTIIRGEQTFDAYAAQGTVALADVIPGYADAAAVAVTQTVGGYNVAVNDGKINMTGDVTVTVTDTAESAKAALEAAEELGWESVDLPMFTETAAWLEAAATLAEGTDVAAILAKAAELKGIVAGTLTVKADATRPRAKKDAYKNLGITGDGWAVTTAEDWFALIDAKDQFSSKNIVVYKDIDFKNIPMKPIQDGNAFNANLLGNGHVFKNINITNTVANAGLNHGGGLISRANGTATQVISNLGLTGTINYTVTSIEATRAARFGALVGNNTATITNCWADVDANVTITGDTTAEIGGLVAYTGNAPITNCSFDGTLNVTVATKTDGTYIGGVVGSAVGGAVTNCTADGEITVNGKNCTNPFYVGGVVGSSNKDVVGCVNSATLKVYGCSANEFIGGVIGRGHGNTVYKCLNEGDLWSDTQTNGNNGIGGIIGTGGNPGVVDACLNIGTVKVDTGVAKGIAGAFNGIASKVYNSVDVGTVIAPSGTGAIMYHNPGYMYDGTNLRVYNVVSLDNIFLGRAANGTNPDAVVTAADGSTHENDTDDWNNAPAYKADSAAEAAWKVNKYYNSTYSSGKGQVFYTINDGVVAFGTADNQVRRIAITRGSSATYAYAVTGDVVDLYAINPALAAAESISSTDVTVENGKFTMVNKDIAVSVSDSLESAKAALADKIEAAWDAEDLNMYTETQAWLANAKDLVANSESASDVIDAVLAIDGILAGELTLDTTAYAPYSKKAKYPDNSTTAYSINTAEDWLKLVNDFKGKACGLTLYVNRDIDFDNTEMLPLAYTGSSGLNSGAIYGQGHTFKNINIKGSDTTNWRTGIALVSAASGTVTIDGLGLTGKVTNTATEATWMEGSNARSHYTAAFIAGKHNNDSSKIVISNCWSDVHVKGPSTATEGLAVFAAYPSNCHSIINCINYGTVESTTNGIAAVFINGRAVNPGTIKNCIDNGTIITTGTAAAIIAHGNMDLTTSTNNWSVNATYNFRDGKANTAVLKPDGTTAAAGSLTNAQVSEIFKITNAKETAYYATKNAGDANLIYTVKDGDVTLGTATDRVYKVELTGDFAATGYYLAGEAVDLAALGLPEGVVLSGDQTATSFTMPAADVAITVAYDESHLAEALVELNALIAQYEKYDLALLDASSTVGAWLEAAAAAKEANTYSAVKAQVVAAEAIVIKLAEGAKPAFNDFDLYAEYNTANNWTVATAADWLKAVSLGTNAKVLSANIYITANIDFTGTAAFAPLAYGGTFTGNVYGGGHVLKNVNIQASAVTGTNGIALISQMSGGMITELGITGTVNGGGTADEHNATAGFVGLPQGSFKIIKCWNGANITSDNSTYATAGGIVGGSNGNKAVIYNGVYNIGTVTSKGSHGTAENYAGAIVGGGSNHGSTFMNIFNAGTIVKNSSTKGDAVLFRVHASDGGTKIVRNTASTNVTVLNYGTAPSADKGIFEATTVVADGYETGEIGYVLNSYYTADGFVPLKDSNGNALEAVYFSFGEDGKVTFGTEATQIRKITYSGVAEGTIYVNQGAKVPFANIAGSGADYYVGGEKIDIETYVMPANDVVMSVEAQYDVEAYNEAYAALSALKAEYAGYDMTLFSNASDMTDLVSWFDFYVEDNDPASIIQQWASYQEAPIVPVLKDGKYVPYSKKAAYAKVDDNTNYGIYDEADWAAMVAAGNNSGKTVYLMNSITLTAAETALITQWSGTFEGQGFTVSGIAITKTSGGKAGLFLTNSGTIKNLTLDGTMNVTFGSADAYVDSPYVGVFGAAGGTVIGCTNSVDITATVYAGDTNNCCIGTINGYLGSVTNSTNEGALNLTLYAEATATRPMIGGIVGRTRAATTGNTNNGDMTINVYGADASLYIGGIGSDSVGADFSNSVNNGSITVNGGLRLYIGGISADTGSVGSLANTTNNGDITVTCRTGDNVRIVRVGGISSSALPANDAETPYTNTGDITVDAAGSNQVYVFGIAPSNTEGVVATNSGAIYVGGMKAADDTHYAGNTTSKEDQTNVTICVHEDRVYTHNADSKTHTMTCADCSHYEVLDCTGEWTYGELAVDGTTVNSTHAMTCELCHEVYDEACVGTLVTNPADCTAGTHVEFDCVCGREDVVLVEGNAEHAWGAYSTEDATAGYERAYCTNSGCECHTERLLPVTITVESAGFVPGQAGTATIKVATGLLKAATFTVSAEGLTFDKNTFTMEDVVDGVITVNFTAANVYEDITLTVTVADAIGADDKAVELEAIEATIAINVTPGDASGDGNVNLIDAIIALREVAGLNGEGVCNRANADIDGNGIINTDDVVLIVRKWLKAN